MAASALHCRSSVGRLSVVCRPPSLIGRSSSSARVTTARERRLMLLDRVVSRRQSSSSVRRSVLGRIFGAPPQPSVD